ncbi:MAG: LysE family translocator [Phyllobacteriaceae bacterium]|nr:LysE family translocator [Phyllobacteriaceae bacterium]
MSFDIFLALLSFSFASSATPGPNNLMLLSSAVTFGFRRTLPHMFGVAIGFTVLLLAVGSGLGAVLTAFPALHVILKIVGGSYLVYLAYRIATSNSIDADEKKNAKPLSFLGAAAFQWANPKGWVMAVTAMATYPDPANYWPSMVLVAVIFGLVNLPSITIWTVAGVVLRNWLADPVRLRIFNITMAVLLVASLWPMLR